MKNVLVVIVALVTAAILSTSAFAGEAYLGTIIVTDAGVSHNLLPTDGGSFAIAPLALITVQPNAAAYVCVDALDTTLAPVCNSTVGVKVAADTAFPTSCNRSHVSLMADGGLVTGCVVTVAPVSGASVSAPVWNRNGNEF